MDFRQRLEQSRVSLVSGNVAAEPEEYFSSPYFATDRGKNSVCLELRFADGSRKAVPYSYFTEIGFDVDAGIEILTAQKRISITGRGLIMLYEALVTFRVRYVQANIGNDEQDEGMYVAEISIIDLD